MTGSLDRTLAVVGRETRTLVRSRVYPGLAAGFALLLVGVAVFAGASSYVTLALTLLTPVELLVPSLAVAFGYRAILADRERGELDVVRTYPVTREEYVLGVYLGRLAGLLVGVVVPLSLVGVAVPLVGGAGTFLPQPGGLDSPTLYLRFVVLTAVFAAVVLAVVTLLSAVADASRRALVAAVALVLVLSVGLDLVAILGLAAGLGDLGAAVTVLGPNGAYRSLVLAVVVSPVTTGPGGGTAPLLSVLVLGGWLGGGLVAAAWRVWTPVR